MSTLEIIFLLFFISLGIQTIYWLSFLRLIFYSRSNKQKKNKPISIIVCAWNEVENLRELVPQLLSQNHPDFEVVIVDDRSVDGSYEYLIEQRDQNQQVVEIRPACRLAEYSDINSFLDTGCVFGFYFLMLLSCP